MSYYRLRRGGPTCPPEQRQEQRPEEINMGSGGHIGPPVQGATSSFDRWYDASVPGGVRWFKTMTTNEYIRMVRAGRTRPFDRQLWQRNYWEHIVRDRQDYDNIRHYIVTNPLRWGEDALHTKQ